MRLWNSTMTCRLSLGLLLLVVAVRPSFAAEAIPPIPRMLPPEGLEIPADVRSRLETRLDALNKQLAALDRKHDAIKPDIEIFTKAVDLALRHREFYVEKDFAKAEQALTEAQ